MRKTCKVRSLLDSSFLIPLIDPKHGFHDRAQEWWSSQQNAGWASCPLTQNAAIRIMSGPTYDKNESFSIGLLTDLMTEFTKAVDHEFWTDSISILDKTIFDRSRILGPNQITDIYLLGLAVCNKGRFVTFDQRVNRSAVIRCKDENLILL